MPALMAWVVGKLTIRLRHDYLAIATFGVAVAFENLMRNAEGLSGGAQGLRGFERPLHAWLGDGFTYNAIIPGLCADFAHCHIPVFGIVDPFSIRSAPACYP